MIKVVIIEDEKPAVSKLERLLSQMDDTFEVQAVMDTTRSAIKWLKDNTPDLIFLDVHLADGISFQIFEEVRVKTPIIFTTAYDQYAIRAFELNSIDYLLKPIRVDDLKRSLDKYKEWKKVINKNPMDFQVLLEAFKNNNSGIEYQKRFIVSSGEKVKSILIEQIAYFYAQQKYVFLITKDNKQYLIDYTLDRLDNVLNPLHFFRINRQFIISFDAIEEMYTYPKGRLKIKLKPESKAEAIVSINKAGDYKEWLNR